MGFWGHIRKTAATAAVTFTLIAPAQADTLADALAASYRNSHVLEQNRALLRATDEGVEQTLAALGPVVEFVAQALTNSEGAPEVQASLSLQASMVLYDFGRGRMRVDQAQARVLATRAALVSVEQSVLLNAANAYLDLYAKLQVVQLRRNNVGVINEQVRAATERFELGDATRTDVEIAEARLAGARSALASAEGDASIAREVYNLAVGRYPRGISAPPSLPRLPASLEAAQATARRLHPSITQAQHMVEVADLSSQIAGRERYGTVSGTLTATAQHQAITGLSETNTTDLTAGLRYGVTLYDGGRLNSLERSAVASAAAERSALHQTVAQVLQSVSANWAMLSVARAGLAASDVQIDASRAAYESVQASAELGSMTTLDVLNSEQELQDARSSRIQAATRVHQAAYALLASMGQMTVESLQLGIPTYDADAYVRGLEAEGRIPPRSTQGSRLDRILGRYRNN